MPRITELALRLAAQITRPDVQYAALAALAPYVSGAALKTATELAYHLKDRGRRADLFVILAPRLPPDAQADIAKPPPSQRGRGTRADVLQAFAPYLGPRAVMRAFTSSLRLKDSASRTSALGALAPLLDDPPSREAARAFSADSAMRSTLPTRWLT